MTTITEFDEVFSEGQTPPPVNPAIALREERQKQDAAVLGEFVAGFSADDAPPADTEKKDD